VRLGIDIGGTKTDAVAVDAAGRVVTRVRRPTGFGAEAVLDTAAAVVQDLTAALDGRSAEPLEVIGVGIPGMVEHETGRVHHAVNLGFDDLDLGELLGERLHAVAGVGNTAVSVENDVNAAAVGAYHVLRIEGSMGFLNLGTGLAAGIVVDGRVWRGASGVAGEIGHVPVDPAGVRCACGQVGCLETKASGSAVARLWPADVPHPAADLFHRAERGESEAGRVCDEVADGVAAAVRMLALTVDVGTIVIGGGLSNLGTPLADRVRAALARAAARSPFLAALGLSSRMRLVPAGSRVAAVGAALAAVVGRPAPRPVDVV
jgi:predicted NBD/HSP70 family sugar kinase